MSAASAVHPPRAGVGVTARLLALVMVPVAALGMLAGSVVLSHRSSAAQAVAVEHGVISLSDLVALRDALHDQQSDQAFDVRFEQLGVTPADASAFLGFNVAAQVGRDRARANQLVTSLGSASPVNEGALQALYTQIDRGVIDPTVAVQRFEGFIDVIGHVITRGLGGLEAQARQGPLVAALESLGVASDLVNLATPQGIDLSAVLFPSSGSTPQAAAAVLARFSQESATYDAAVAQLRQLGVTSVVAAVGHIEADPQVQSFEQTVSATLAGQPLAAADANGETTKVLTTFRGYLARDTLLKSLEPAAITAVRDQAQHLADSQQAEFLAWALAAAALALVSIALAVALARSIRGPLKDLADYAHAISEGRLDAEPPPSYGSGPRETRVAFGVFAEVVANLQLLDAKANALAHCDFDDPILTEPLPGRLGRSLASSVEMLSGSIVERDQLQIHLAHEATHDSLTGISNRPAAITAIEAAMNRGARTGATTALLYIDLNEFKAVNDSHGHEVGDDVLRQVATRLSADLRAGDFVARLGGDEFVVIAEGIADAADAAEVARRVIETITEPIETVGIRVMIGAAVGIAMTLDWPEEPLRLLARADAAMYRAKHHDRSAIEIFDAALQQQMIQREDIESALAAALADPAGGGLRLEYQPVVDATDERLVGAEALLRWDRPGHGLLVPDSFIPIAEATALIIDLDCWVLNQAARQVSAWSTHDELANIPVAVNISGRHLLSRQLPGHIRTVLDDTGIDPHRLSIEITETVLLADLVTAATELEAIRALGIKVAIDDFGTGYTSLAHLQQLPIDTIKIDRCFISQLNARRGASLVRMVTDLGHAIDINIVAEGVETDDEKAALQTIGADYLQGYLLSKPLRPDLLTAWAHRHHHPQISTPA